MNSSNEQKNLVIFTGKYSSWFAIECVERIARTFPHWTVTVFQERPRRRRWPYLKAKLRQAVREPVSFGLSVLGSLASKWRGPVPRPHGSPVGLPESLERISLPNVAYRKVASLHGAETLQAVRALNPWLGVSLSAPILKRKLFGIPERGTINVHKSLLPDYRGMPPGFWELHDGAPRTGVSIHWVDDGLDTGALILQRALDIPPYATPKGLTAALDLLGTEVLIEVLRQFEDGTAKTIPQPPATTPTNRMPSALKAWQVERLTWRRRRGTVGPLWSPRHIVKTLILLAYLFLYVPPRNLLRRLTGRSHVSVLLYHRVNDGFLDSVTVGVEQFTRQLELLARRYDILDLPALLASRGRPRRRPAVVLTFDDGYEDNFLAAMILRRKGLPCTFFLSTRIVGTADRAFPHDLKRLGRRVPPISWDQVRTMQAWSFHFGNHSCYHVNLAEVPLDDAVTEIATASKDLERELGTSETARVLAYPYGRKQDFSEEVRRRLPGLGISSCLSAYGGSTPPDFDSLNIRRQGVSYDVSNLRLLAAVEGWGLT